MRFTWPVLVALACVGCSESHSGVPDGGHLSALDGRASSFADGRVPSPDGGGEPRDGAVSPDGWTPPPPVDALASGTGVLVDLFVSEEGLLLVLSDAVLLIARDGTELARWPAPRELTTAAFDGTYLGVADRAALTTLSASLDELRSTFLTEPCSSSAIVSDHRFVCGPENDWDRIFYTYDLETGLELGRSMPETYNGIPMRVIPGRDAFVTVSGGSPSDFHMYVVGASGVATFMNESPYHGDFPASTIHAFDGVPATHLVTHQGLLLLLDPCAPGSSSISTCFVRDGTLGTLRSREQFVAMDTGADGFLYGLVDEPISHFAEICESGCALQRVHVASRTIMRSVPWDSAMGNIVALRHDPMTGGVVVGGHAMCDYGRDCTDWMVRSGTFE